MVLSKSKLTVAMISLIKKMTPPNRSCVSPFTVPDNCASCRHCWCAWPRGRGRRASCCTHGRRWDTRRSPCGPGYGLACGRPAWAAMQTTCRTPETARQREASQAHFFMDPARVNNNQLWMYAMMLRNSIITYMYTVQQNCVSIFLPLILIIYWTGQTILIILWKAQCIIDLQSAMYWSEFVDTPVRL